MDLQKKFALFSSVGEDVPLKFKGDESEKGQRALKVDVQDMLKQKPYQKTTETIMEGIPDGLSSAIGTGKTENVKQPKVYSEVQEIAKISRPVPHIGKTSAIEDGAEEEKGDKREGDVLIDVGNYGGSDYSSTEKQHNAKGFQWKMLAFLLLVIGSSTAASVMFGKMSHVDVNKEEKLKTLGPGGLNPVEFFENFVPHWGSSPIGTVPVLTNSQGPWKETYKRTKRQTGGNIYLVTRYKPLNLSEGCPIVKSMSCDKDGEKPVCVRNVTRTNLVEACVTNMSITYGCPVFVNAKNKTHSNLTVVQFEDDKNCSSCPTEVYGLHDVEKYNICMEISPVKRTTDPGYPDYSFESEKKSSAECEREEECKFQKLKRNIVSFAGACLGFGIFVGVSTCAVYRLRK